MSVADMACASPDEELVFCANPVLESRHTHYCPGCHHGIAHRLVSEALHELDIAKRTIAVASVGCSALMYTYLRLDWLEAPHGRACAVATGVKRARPDKIVFTYQGDGDLGAIGLNESLQAGNRGEKLSVIFINNTVYGMTGGQMAPTTLPGQKTTTSPKGRSIENEGAPLKMAELMAQLDGVVYSARCSLDSVKNVMAAKKAVRKAFEIQVEGKGFAFVELLSGCPTNWRMDTVKANKYISETMIPYFPLGVMKDLPKGEK